MAADRGVLLGARAGRGVPARENGAGVPELRASATPPPPVRPEAAARRPDVPFATASLDAVVPRAPGGVGHHPQLQRRGRW